MAAAATTTKVMEAAVEKEVAVNGGAGWGRVDGWAVVERVEGRVAESVDERVVGHDGGGGLNGGECVRRVEGGWCGGCDGGAPLAALAAAA